MNGEDVHWEKREGRSQNRTISSLICERCILGVVGDFKWDENWAYTLGSGTEGVVIGRVRSLSSRPEQALYWPRIAEIPLQGLTSAVALVLYIHTGVSKLLAHDEEGGSSFPSSFLSGEALPASKEGGEMTAAGVIAVRHFAYHERLPSAKLGLVENGGTRQSGPGTEVIRLYLSRHHRGRDGGGVRE